MAVADTVILVAEITTNAASGILIVQRSTHVI